MTPGALICPRCPLPPTMGPDARMMPTRPPPPPPPAPPGRRTAAALLRLALCSVLAGAVHPASDDLIPVHEGLRQRLRASLGRLLVGVLLAVPRRLRAPGRAPGRHREVLLG